MIRAMHAQILMISLGRHFVPSLFSTFSLAKGKRKKATRETFNLDPRPQLVSSLLLWA